MRRICLLVAMLFVGCWWPAGPAPIADVGASSSDANTDVSNHDAGPDASCADTAERGVWMYRHPGNSLGTDHIVGDATEEMTARNNLQADQINRVYGNYGGRPVNDTATVASWNAQLEADGIQSQLLIGDGDDIFPGCRQEMIQRVQARLIDFNASVTADEQFVALHLDIEPQQYKQGAAWPTATTCGQEIQPWAFWDELGSTGRAERYDMLRETLIEVRTYLDANGHMATPIYVDLAPWIDSSSNFDWSTSAVTDGTDWLTQVAAQVDGMTFMTYERDSASSIDSAVAGESSLNTQLRVSVNARERSPLSSTTTWTDLNDMWAVVGDLEATHCGARPVDLFNYRYLHE